MHQDLLLLLLVAAIGLANLSLIAAQNTVCDASQQNYGCSNFGRCQTVEGLCQCNPGFSGNGQSCESACLYNKRDGLCDPAISAACVDLPSNSDNFTCACKQGYYFNQAVKTCQDVNECTRFVCSPYSECINEIGNYQCKCCYSNDGIEGYSGFGYKGDGKTQCYPDSILQYGGNEDSKFLNESGYIRVNVPGGFPFYGKLHYDIFVHTNGLVTFDVADIPYWGGDISPTFPNVDFVAPFWTQLQPSPNEIDSGLYVDVYSLARVPGGKTENNRIDKVLPHLTSWLDDINLPDFRPRQILTATWKSMSAANLPEADQITKARITFQSTIVSNGSHSFGWTSYAEDPVETEWTYNVEGVYIGINGEHIATRRPVKEISELFQTPPEIDSICTNMNFLTQRGRWYRVFGEPFVENNNVACLSEASQQWNKHGSFSIAEENDEGNALPPSLYCPCFEQQAVSDNRFVEADLEPVDEQRHSCYISRFFKDVVATNEEEFRSRAYCCYDGRGALVTQGPAAGGIVPVGYEENMKRLKNVCCVNADMCDAFHNIYTPVTCRRYDRPRVAYVRGAAHFNSFANGNYTFNGRGEFVYFSIKDPIIDVQLRLENRTYENGITSFVTAMAVSCDVPADQADTDPAARIPNLAEVRVNSGGSIEMLVNGTLITPLPYKPFEFSNMFLASCDAEFCEFTCKFSNNIFAFQARLVNDYLRINATIPAASEVPTLFSSGIAGTPEGDLVYSNELEEVIMVENFTDSAEIFKFGNYWRVNDTDSLFTYDGGDSWETYNSDSDDYKPSYWSELRPTITADNLDVVCHCESDQACQFDQLVTGDKSISSATHQALKTIENDRYAFETPTAQWNSPRKLVISIHKDAEGNVGDYVQFDETGVNAIKVDHYELVTDLNPKYYYFNASTGHFIIYTSKQDRKVWRLNTYSLTVYAVKLGSGDAVARSRVDMAIFVCACDEESQCDYSYADRTYLQLPTDSNKYYVLPCHCEPPAAATNAYCDGERNPCLNDPCHPNGYCQVDEESPQGYTCSCLDGYSGNGFLCESDLKCPEGCDQGCAFDWEINEAVCSCRSGYILQADQKTCKDINECNFPAPCNSPNEICRNTNGSFYCECQAGYKPEKGALRSGCLEAPFAYSISLEFEAYWDVLTREWSTWNDELADQSSARYNQIARQTEPILDLLLNLIEPEFAKYDLYTFINKFEASQNIANGILMHFKIYPKVAMDEKVLRRAFREYFSGQPDGSIFKGVNADSITVLKLSGEDQCGVGCGSPFANCHTSDEDGRLCRCNPGFVLSPTSPAVDNVTCDSYCKRRDCKDSHSCRDYANFGPQCLCQRGFKYDDKTLTCQRINFCTDFGPSPCGENAKCVDVVGTYSCECDEGFLPTNLTAPQPACYQEVLYDEIPPEHADGVYVEYYEKYAKVLVPVGFPYAGTKQWKVYVGLNGVISFGKRPTATELQAFYPSTYGYYIAPLWTDFVWNRSSIAINVYDSTLSERELWEPTFEQIRSDIKEAEGYYPYLNVFGYPNIANATAFEPTTVIAVTWSNVHLKPFKERDYATFQTIIASDGVATFVISNYDNMKSSLDETWDQYPHRGFVGFQIGTRRLCLEKDGFKENSKDCRTFHYKQLSSRLSVSLPNGRHVYLAANQANVTTQPDRKCFDTLQQWVVKDQKDYIELSAVYSTVANMRPLPDVCPWTETEVLQDQRFIKLIGGACYNKRFSTAIPYHFYGNDTVAHVRPYCCYDKSGALLRQATSNTHLIVEEFRLLQNQIFDDCCKKSAHCPYAALFSHSYFVANDYEPPATVAVFGDPHLVTIDGFNFTFKGRGNYVLYNHEHLQLQGHFGALANADNGSALLAVSWQAGQFMDQMDAWVNSSTGELHVMWAGEVINLQDYNIRGGIFNETHGHLRAKTNQSEIIGFTMTYTDGLAFDVTAVRGFAAGTYLQLRVRLPRSIYHLDSTPSGLLGTLIDSMGTKYEPVVYHKMYTGDEHFYPYGKSWNVLTANVTQLLTLDDADDDYIPSFYEDYFKNPTPDHPTLDACNGSIECAYDHMVTGDADLALRTLMESSAIHKIRAEASERPPTFDISKPIWIIYVNTYYNLYEPTILDYSPDIVFSMQTDFPRHLYTLDPATGYFLIMMTDEAKETLLYKGPFTFNMIATRGSTGASSFKPMIVRICNCLEERSCDFTDDRDETDIGIVPSENAQRYSVARCNCFPFQTGKFCDQDYNGCESSPCYPGVPCVKVRSDMITPAFTCFGCPFGMEGDGVHCTPKNVCKNKKCDSPKTCLDVNGEAQCVCPAGLVQNSDGTCVAENRCEDRTKPRVCAEIGMTCNNAPMGRYYCGCMPGYAPIYKPTWPPELQLCRPISYTYHGQVSFQSYYTPEQELSSFSLTYTDPSLDVGRSFARNVTADLKNAINLLKYQAVISVSIQQIAARQADYGFIVDYFAFADLKLKPSEIQTTMSAYFAQTGNAGTLVNISAADSFFVDICNSKTLNPCQDIIDLAICQQLGLQGISAQCECKRSLEYFPYPFVDDDGKLMCKDLCDSSCKAADANSKCIRPNGEAKPHECVCQDGFKINSVSGMCEAKPKICDAQPCGPNSDCVPAPDEESRSCVCRLGYTENAEKNCITFCEQASFCKNTEKAFGCSNLDYSYKCTCEAGYRWNGQSLKCEDVDECLESPFLCPVHSTCQNKEGSYDCNCDAGYSHASGYGDDKACYGNALYPYGNSRGAAFINDSDGVWSTTFYGGFYYNNNLFFKIFVGFDGFISFEKLPPTKYFGKTLSSHLIAPFFMDLEGKADVTQSGLHIDLFDKASSIGPDSTWKAIFELVIKDLKTQYPNQDVPDDAVPDMMIIATWNSVHPAPGSIYGQYKTTAQAVFTMLSGFSFVVLNYYESPMFTNWPSVDQLPAAQPLVGFTSGDSASGITFQTLNGKPNSFANLFSDNGPQIRGRHVVSFGEKVFDLQSRECLDQYRNFPREVTAAIEEINESPQLQKHSSCPGFAKQMEVDARWQPEIELADANVTCYGGSFWTRINVTSGVYKVRSFCCYDIPTGAYLDNTPPTRYAGSFFQIEQYRKIQEDLFNPCCRKSPYCEAFSLKHNSSSLSPEYYVGPSIGYVIGDPHLGIMSHSTGEQTPGREIIFNGRGEYTLVKSGDYSDERISAINIQGRFMSNNVTSRATFLTGVAIQVGRSDVVEVISHDEILHVFRNGTRVNLTLIMAPSAHDVVEEDTFDLWSGSNFIGYVAHSGVSLAINHIDKKYLEVRVTLPNFIANLHDIHSCGLLTSFEEAPYLDCDGKEGSGFEFDIWENEQDAYTFGQRFKLTSQAQSLFSYQEGPDFATLNNADKNWTPTFKADLNGKYPNDTAEICGSSTACEFDYGITFNSQIATQTRSASAKYKQQQIYDMSAIPDVFEGRETSLAIRETDSDTVFHIEFVNHTRLVYEIETNIPAAFFTFDHVNGAFDLPITQEFLVDIRKRREAPYVRFLALWNPTAAIYSPSFFTCACDQVSQCDFDYRSLGYLERLSNLKHNYFLPCKCPATRRGAYCDIDFNPCDEKPCPSGVSCTKDDKLSTGYTCGACPPAYDSVGGTCKAKICPADYCENGNCEVSSSDGSFVCKCLPGYEYLPGSKRTCQDINECLLGTHDCWRLGQGMQCINTPGSYTCGCKPGFSPDNATNVLTCTKEKNQLDGNLKVDSVLVGSTKITWSDELSVIGGPLYVSVTSQMEIDILEWYRKDLGQPETKRIYIKKLTQGSIKADYSAYFETAVDSKAIEARQTQFFSTSTSIGNMVGVDPASATVTTDLCLQDTSCDLTSTKCVWDATIGVATCECLGGFVSIPQSPTTCADNCTAICSDKLGSKSQCVRNQGQYSCACLPGYFEDSTTKICSNLCDKQPCKNGGTCGATTTGYVCECAAKYYGDTCDKKCLCENDGICDANGNCFCKINYIGDKCETKREDPAPTSDSTLIIVGAVLGSTVFILLIVIIVLIATSKKKSKNGTDEIELEVRAPTQQSPPSANAQPVTQQSVQQVPTAAPSSAPPTEDFYAAQYAQIQKMMQSSLTASANVPKA